MNNCPECGEVVELQDVSYDVATDHNQFTCTNGHVWIETVTKSGELVNITKDESGEDEE